MAAKKFIFARFTIISGGSPTHLCRAVAIDF
jgi:hypothetical protein